MKSTNILVFLAGAACGSLITWKLVKDKYEKIANEEIEAVREVYMSDKEDKEETPKEELSEDEDDPDGDPELQKYIKQKEDFDEYRALLNRNLYVADSLEHSKKGADMIDEYIDKYLEAKPYVIAPSDVDDEVDYEYEELSYYEDGVLANDWLEVIHEIEEYIGYESLKFFGEHEPDVVYVRNDKMKKDFKVTYEHAKYSDVNADYISLSDED